MTPSNKLLIYIVSYQRREFTEGTIKYLTDVLPENAQIIVCDNGSTDGTREWLEANQDKYNLGLLFPESNLRVGGAWTLLTNYYDKGDFDYILLLDNDGWMNPQHPDWYQQCLELFNSDSTIGSLGLGSEKERGFFGTGKFKDPNFESQKQFKDLTYYDTIYYAAFRLDKFDLWHNTMSSWRHKFIGDKIGIHYRSVGYRTLKLSPGFVIDISEYNFDNENHVEYNKWFHQRERTAGELEHRLNIHSSSEGSRDFLIKTFGPDCVKYL